MTNRGDGVIGKPSVVNLSSFVDDRGSLVVGEVGAAVPFAIERFFAVSGVPAGASRGAHAHRRCEQFLVCLAGSVTAVVDDGRSRFEVSLDSPSKGLYMPAETWGTQRNYTHDAVLLVLASRGYEPDDYITDYDEFRTLVRSASAG